MDKQEWWELFDKNADKLRDLVGHYHPARAGLRRAEAKITAPGAEAACNVVRDAIAKEATMTGVQAFEAALEKRDSKLMSRVLNDTWFGMPESTSVRYEPGFDALCDLCEGVDEDEEQGE